MAKRDKRHRKERPPSPQSLQASWRLFIAVPMPDDVRHLVARLINEMSADEWPVRWIDPESAHLTLHFLGDTAPDRAELLRLALTTPIAGHKRMELRTSELGVFPNPRQPRVIWLGLGGDVGGMERLTRDIGRTLKGLDFPVEHGRFRPHITLGRVRDNPPPDLPGAIERGLNDAMEHLTTAEVPIEEVLLVRSFLGRGGASHEPIGRYPLTGSSKR